jgi:hypothetical protein
MISEMRICLLFGPGLAYNELDHSLPVCVPARCLSARINQPQINTMYYHCGARKKIGYFMY